MAPSLTNNGNGRFFVKVHIIPLDNISNRTRQQMILYHHPRKTGVRISFAYIYSPANNLLKEMKDIYTNTPASNISKMPELFKTAIENSRLWKWERS
jgi:hypothetical protein